MKTKFFWPAGSRHQGSFCHVNHMARMQLSARKKEQFNQQVAMLALWSQTYILQNYEKINFYCLSHLVYGILLWQLELNKTFKSYIRVMALLINALVERVMSQLSIRNHFSCRMFWHCSKWAIGHIFLCFLTPNWKVAAELWTALGFLASRGEGFNLGPVMRLDRSELLCNTVLLKYKRDRESFWHRHQKRAERVPPC